MKWGLRVKKWTGAFQVAAVYVGTVIGAGFATGKEIVEFFTQYSLYGFFGILLAGFLFIMMGTKMMLMSIDIRASSFKEFNEYLFGSFFSKIMNIFMTIMLIGVCAVMLSGAEALFLEQLGIPKFVGSIVTITLSILVMTLGVKGLFAVNTFVVPILIVFNLMIMYSTFYHDHFPEYLLITPGIKAGWKAAGSAFSYAAFNLALAQAVLVPIATEINDKRIVKLGGILGGFLLTVILISSHISLGALPNLLEYDIPMAVVVRNTFKNIYFIYLFIIFGEIFTSLIGNLYGIERQLRKYVEVKSIWIFIIIMVIVYLVGRVDYGQLLGILYPLFGYISLAFLVLLWKKSIQK